MNVLFNKTPKNRIFFKGKSYNHKELWKFITNEIKNYYKIENKENLLFCKLKCMSIPPFLKSLEFHTGIKLDWENVKIENEKNFYPENSNLFYTNRHILNLFWKPENIIEINPISKSFSFTNFLCNQNKSEEFIMNFSNIIINRNLNVIENFDKFVLIRYYFEKIKKVNFFIVWYVIFFKELKIKKLEKINNIKEKNLLVLNNNNNNNILTRTNNDNISKEIESFKDEKNNMNNILSKKNECIDLYNHIYNDLKHLSLNNVNSEFDLTGLIYVTQNNYFNDENNVNYNNNNHPCNEQKKKFSFISFSYVKFNERN